MRIINAHNSRGVVSRGGIEKIFLVKASMFESVEYNSVSACYHSLEIADSAALVGCAFAEGEACFTETSVRKNGNVQIAQKLEFSLGGQIEAAIAFIEELCQADCGLVAVVIDSNSLARIVGYSEALGLEQPLRAETVVGSSQSDFEKTPSQKITLSTLSPCKAGVLVDDIDLVTR